MGNMEKSGELCENIGRWCSNPEESVSDKTTWMMNLILDEFMFLFALKPGMEPCAWALPNPCFLVIYGHRIRQCQMAPHSVTSMIMNWRPSNGSASKFGTCKIDGFPPKTDWFEGSVLELCPRDPES